MDLQQYVLDLPLPNEVFFALVEATAKLVDLSDKYWQSQGLHGARVRILVELMKEGDTLLPSLLANKIGVTKANVSLLLTPLEQDGLILREPHPSDGRKWVVSITATGQNFLLRHLPENRQRVADAMNVLNTQEQQQLLILLAKLKNG